MMTMTDNEGDLPLTQAVVDGDNNDPPDAGQVVSVVEWSSTTSGLEASAMNEHYDGKRLAW